MTDQSNPATQPAHTPGPWLSLKATDGRGKRYIRTADRHAVCRVTETGRSYEEQEANVRLIAAAPEMLEALTLALRYLHGAPLRLDTVENAIIDALAKASNR